MGMVRKGSTTPDLSCCSSGGRGEGVLDRSWTEQKPPCHTPPGTEHKAGSRAGAPAVPGE